MYKWSRRGKWLWWISPLSLSSRSDCVHTYRQHSVRSRSRSLHDPPQRAGHHGHTHLPTLALLQAHRGASWSGAHGKNEAEEAGLAVLGHHELSEQLQWQRFSKCLNSTRGISKWFSPHLVFCDCEGRSHNDSVGAPTYQRLFFFFFFLVLDVMFVVWSFYLSLLMFDSITAPYVFIVLRYRSIFVLTWIWVTVTLGFVPPPLWSRLKYLNIYWMYCHDISQTMNVNDFGDSLTCPLAPPWGFVWNVWMDLHTVWCTYSCHPSR